MAIYVDLDGTLAFLGPPVPPGVVGPPVPAMLARVKRWLERGEEVVIFTARATQADQIPLVDAWCLEHLGRTLPVTCIKGLDLIEVWDDRAIQVERNTGSRADGKED